MKKNKGFTLIELLVVIAIIGILSSVVLASLNSARNKGADAAVKSNLANARAQAEIFYDSNTNSYYTNSTTGNVCSTSALANGNTGIYKQVLAAAKATGLTGLTATLPATTSVSVCYATASLWVATAPLKTPAATGNIYCVDSTGFSGEVAASAVTTTSPSCN